MATKLILTILCVTSTVLRGVFAAPPLQHGTKNLQGQNANLTGASEASPGVPRRPACPSITAQQHSPKVQVTKHQKRTLPPPISQARRKQLSREGAELLEELFKDTSEVPQSRRTSYNSNSSPWTRRELPLDASSTLLYPLFGLAGTNERPLSEVDTMDMSEWKRVEYIQDRDYWSSEERQEPTRASFTLTYSFSQRVVVMERSISPWFTNMQAGGFTWPPNVEPPNPYRWPDIAFMEYASMRPTLRNHFMSQSPAWFYIPTDAGSPDTIQVISYCLQAMGQADLPFWPGVTFPIGSECHRLILATSSSQQVANFLKEHRSALGSKTLVSVTVFASCSSNEPSDTRIPSLLWAVSTLRLTARMQDSNQKWEDKGNVENWPHAFTPKYPQWQSDATLQGT